MLICGDCLEVMKTLPDKSVDLTVTSPPYDNLRNYNGHSQFDFEGIARQLFRLTKPGGVVVWVVGDATIDGSETGTSLRQALYFKEIGLNLYDTMIWNKENCSAIGDIHRYENIFEYMFIFSAGHPKTTDIIRDKKNKRAGEIQSGSIRQPDGTVRKTSGYGKRAIAEYGRRGNVWTVFPAKAKNERLHPAPFPVNLAKDHVVSWSHRGETVLDPFMGSGTTGVACVQTGRDFIGIEIDPGYFAIAERRIKDAEAQGKLFQQTQIGG